jgi:L-arabinokinase
MYRIVSPPSIDLPDTGIVIAVLNSLTTSASPELRDLFSPNGDIVISRAPGRLDVKGGIADYSGSLVLEMPLEEATFAAVQLDSSRILRIVSVRQDSEFGIQDSGGRIEEKPGANRIFEMSLHDLECDGEPVSYEMARARFQSNRPTRWAAYVAGVFLVLMREKAARFDHGARMLILSAVPEGKGVSSSAALEVAAMQAVTVAFGIELQPHELAILCQMVENLVVGAPCGVMDQLTSACGRARHLLGIRCQPADITGTIAIPDDIAIWGLESGVRHSVAGSVYANVRVAAFMGYRMIAELAGLKVTRRERGVEIDDPIWRGYLANLTPAEFEREFAPHLPERVTGAEFLTRFQGTTDPVTEVEPECVYGVRAATSHPVYENHRANLFAEMIGSAENAGRHTLIGELMYQSHASYSLCGLGSDGTDLLVRLVREAGPEEGIYGARITGGGSGGTVAVLASRDAGDAISRAASRYAELTGHQPQVFFGSSPGASEFGHVRLR